MSREPCHVRLNYGIVEMLNNIHEVRRVEIVLYRIKIMRSKQHDLFDTQIKPSQLLRDMILEKPTAASARGTTWHIGNLETVDEASVYFKLGRTTKATLPVLVQGTGDFVDERYDSAPYTHAFIDFKRELCGIAVKTAVAPTTDAIARQLGRLLASTRSALASQVVVAVAAINEPEQLLNALRSAYAITSFTVYFTRPNPMDVNEDFLKPMERLTQESGADSGHATVSGEALDPEPLTDLVRSAAATGDEAVAKLKSERGAKTVRRSLRGQHARVSEEEPSTPEGRLRAISKIRRKQSEIRGTDADEAA